MYLISIYLRVGVHLTMPCGTPGGGRGNTAVDVVSIGRCRRQPYVVWWPLASALSRQPHVGLGPMMACVTEVVVSCSLEEVPELIFER